jgi:hypothetical protein
MRPPFAFALSAFVLMGCPSPLGQPCDQGRCPAGYACTQESVPSGPSTTTYRYFCSRACVRNSDCGEGVDCATNNAHPDSSRYCNEFGTLLLNEPCRVGEGARCAPGLACSSYEGVCLPACNPDSPHTSDRECPSGLTCWPGDRDFSLTGIPYSYGVCRPECEPAAADACRPTLTCRRWTSPGFGVVATCEGTVGVGICTNAPACPDGQVCQDDVCYAPADAPPRRPDEWFPPLTAPID